MAYFSQAYLCRVALSIKVGGLLRVYYDFSIFPDLIEPILKKKLVLRWDAHDMTDDTKSEKGMHKSGWMVPPRPNVPREESNPSKEERERRMSVLLPTKSPDKEDS